MNIGKFKEIGPNHFILPSDVVGFNVETVKKDDKEAFVVNFMISCGKEIRSKYLSSRGEVETFLLDVLDSSIVRQSRGTK